MARNEWNIEIKTHEFKLNLARNKKDSMFDVGKFILSRMDFYVPVDTGYLMSRNRARTVIPEEELIFYNDCLYAGYQEYGTRYQPGTPFMRPAVFNHIGDIKKVFERGLSRGL